VVVINPGAEDWVYGPDPPQGRNQQLDEWLATLPEPMWLMVPLRLVQANKRGKRREEPDKGQLKATSCQLTHRRSLKHVLDILVRSKGQWCTVPPHGI
jgi:hypothetical protein